MPHSPYIQHVQSPISDYDLESFGRDLQRIQWEEDDGINDKYAVDTTLQIGQRLLEHCKFLEAKLTIKKRENFKLATQSEALEKKVAALEKERGVLKDKNKQELTALRAKVKKGALKATLEDKLVAQGKEEADGSIDNQVKQGGGADAGDPNRPAKAGPDQDDGLEVESSQLAAAPPASSPRKRELESDANADQKRPPKKAKKGGPKKGSRRMGKSE